MTELVDCAKVGRVALLMLEGLAVFVEKGKPEFRGS